MLEIPLIPASIVLLASLVAAVLDVWKFKVYNALTVPLLLTGLAYHTMASGLQGLQGSLMGSLFGFAVLIVFYAMGGIGAGDVKLMAAVGAWLCMPLTFYVFVLAPWPREPTRYCSFSRRAACGRPGSNCRSSSSGSWPLASTSGPTVASKTR